MAGSACVWTGGSCNGGGGGAFFPSLLPPLLFALERHTHTKKKCNWGLDPSLLLLQKEKYNVQLTSLPRSGFQMCSKTFSFPAQVGGRGGGTFFFSPKISRIGRRRNCRLFFVHGRSERECFDVPPPFFSHFLEIKENGRELAAVME